MKQVKIRYNPNGDARTLDHFPDYDEMKDAVLTHKNNMSIILKHVGNKFYSKADKHDNTVIDNFDDYYVATAASYNKEVPFRESDWYKNYFLKEEYRKQRFDPSTSNLLDLIEGICDHKVTTNERLTEVPGLLNKDQVYQMYLNTVKEIEESIEVVL